MLDPQSPMEFVIRRPAVESVAKGEPWLPAHIDEDLIALFEGSVSLDPSVRSIRMVAGDLDARGTSEDVILQVALVPGQSQDQVMRTLQALSTAWAGESLFAERIDSIKIQVIPGK